MALNPGVPPAPEWPAAELYEWVRRDEQYATLAANVVVELYGERHARRPTTRAWAIIRRAHRIHRLVGQRANRAERRHTDRADRTRGSWKSQPRAADAPAEYAEQVGALYVQLVGTDMPPAALAARWMVRWLAEHDDQGTHWTRVQAAAVARQLVRQLEHRHHCLPAPIHASPPAV
jgi:hypothetical protein